MVHFEMLACHLHIYWMIKQYTSKATGDPHKNINATSNVIIVIIAGDCYVSSYLINISPHPYAEEWFLKTCMLHEATEMR